MQKNANNFYLPIYHAWYSTNLHYTIQKIQTQGKWLHARKSFVLM